MTADHGGRGRIPAGHGRPSVSSPRRRAPVSATSRQARRPAAPRYGGDATVRFTGSTHDERAFITKDMRQRSARSTITSPPRSKTTATRSSWSTPISKPGRRRSSVGYGVTSGAVRAAVATARALTASRCRHWSCRACGRCRSERWPRRWTASDRGRRRAQPRPVPPRGRAVGGGTHRVVGINRIDGELIAPEAIVEVDR